MQTAARKTILILMSDTGGGHRTVAEAIREAVQLLYPERYTVIVEDLFLRSRWPGPPRCCGARPPRAPARAPRALWPGRAP